MNRADWLAYLKATIRWWKEVGKGCTPSNLYQWHIIETGNNILLHGGHVRSSLSGPISELSSAPVLLDVVQLAVEFGVEIADVPSSSDEFFECRLLCTKIGLTE
jgi:hypothetical protein